MTKANQGVSATAPLEGPPSYQELVTALTCLALGCYGAEVWDYDSIVEPYNRARALLKRLTDYKVALRPSSLSPETPPSTKAPLETPS